MSKKSTDPQAAQASATAKAAEAQQAEGAEDEVLEPQTSWFGRQLVWMSTAWGSSLVVHLALILVLGLLVLPAAIRPEVKDLVATIEERPEELLNQVLEESTEASESLSVSASASALSAGMQASVASLEPPQVLTEVSNAPTEVHVDVGEMNVFAAAGSSLATDLPNGTLGEASAVVESYSDAMDRLTQEILNRLARGKVLVVWAFDQSESMQDDRAEIQARIERVYTELGLSSTAQGDALLTSITSYGAGYMLHTPQPTYNIAEIMAAIEAVPNDPSGEEQMCRAIGTAISQHRQFTANGRRQMMFVLVTDEAGDATTNNQYLEATIAEAKGANCPIYTLGREAVFGYPYAHYTWIDPETKETFWIRIDRGPETPLPEQLQVDGYHRRYDAHPSGFGPYEQTRMARQTGGVFFMLPSPEADLWRRDDRKYEIEAMRPYLPDLSARVDYVVERDRFEPRRVVWQVISDLNPYRPELQNVVQVKVDFFPLDQAAFARVAQENVAKAKRLIEYFKAAENELARVKDQLSRDPSPRWRANFEITYAQTIAYQVRLYEYIYVLEDFVKNPKPVTNKFGPNRLTTDWEIHRRAPLLTGDRHKDQVAQATELFRAVIKDHPGTPWAARADYELRRGWGCSLEEEYHHPDRNKVQVPKY